jgi:HK97 gp10 family phage protein
MRVKVKVTGGNDLIEALRQAGNAGREAIDAVVHEVAEDIVHRARSGMTGGGVSAPGAMPHSQTGRLAGSIRAEFSEGGQRITAIVGTDEPHGYFLEFGTGKMQARPWLMPSYEAAISHAVAKLRDEFNARLS